MSGLRPRDVHAEVAVVDCIATQLCHQQAREVIQLQAALLGNLSSA